MYFYVLKFWLFLSRITDALGLNIANISLFLSSCYLSGYSGSRLEISSFSRQGDRIFSRATAYHMCSRVVINRKTVSIEMCQ